MKPSRPLPRSLSLLLALALLLAGCTSPQTPASEAQPTRPPLVETLVTFQVTLPAPLQAGESVALAVLDEVTGLGFNQQLNPLTAIDNLHYSAVLPLRIGSVLKYRYLRQGTYTAQEHQPDGLPVRYRMHVVTSQAVVADTVSRWTDTPFAGETGRILGTVRDAQTGAPLPNLLAAAGGLQTLTGADGTYLLEGLPVGTHNLVIYAQDGAYPPTQHGATIAPDATTPADFTLSAAPQVQVTFIVSLPPNTSPDAVVRLAGNFIQLGNTFTDLTGGVSTLAARMPALAPQPDGRHALTLTLPAGADLRYKYTLGDGIWNAEYNAEGSLNLRQLIIPAQPVTLEEKVVSWAATGPAPVTFQVPPPAVLPPGDNLSIQLNPSYGWLEPLPMWPRPDGSWSFTLYSPLQSLDSLQYRYCRNEQCGSADDLATAGPLATGRVVSLLDQPQIVTDRIDGWQWLPALAGPATVPNLAVNPRSPFVAGVALQPAYHPSWTPHFAQTARYIADMNANWLILSPTWSYAAEGAALLAANPQLDITGYDLQAVIRTARQAGLSVSLFPQPNFPTTPAAYWSQAQGDYPWWYTWFDRYRAFVIHHARLAAAADAGMLVLGGGDLLPAIPLPEPLDASPSNPPPDAVTWWNDLFAEVRSVYPGAIAWALPFPQGLGRLPPFIDQVDIVYVEFSVALAGDPALSDADLLSQTAAMLDGGLIPFMLDHQKPVVLALGYASAQGALTGCIRVQENQCLDPHQLERPNPDLPPVALSLDEQTRAYNSLLQLVNERPWIGGIVSTGFYPPAMLQDKSASVHGKPAAGALWYWFGAIVGD